MLNTYPGMTVEVGKIEKGSSRVLFDGVFAAGGITLSQISVMTGLEPYLIQNWVKRGFVTSPVKRLYSRKQFARIVIINMLKESLQIDKICTLIKIIGGNPNDESDDLISDDELYHRYVDMLAQSGGMSLDRAVIAAAAAQATVGYEEPIQGAKKRLETILQVMAYAHYATWSRQVVGDMLADLL